MKYKSNRPYNNVYNWQIDNLFVWPSEMTHITKGGNLPYLITYVIWANQKTEYFVYRWLRPLDITCYPAFIGASDVISILLSYVYSVLWLKFSNKVHHYNNALVIPAPEPTVLATRPRRVVRCGVLALLEPRQSHLHRARVSRLHRLAPHCVGGRPRLHRHCLLQRPRRCCTMLFFTMHSSAKLRIPPLSVLVYCSCNKVYHKQEVRFFVVIRSECHLTSIAYPLD